MLCLYRVVYLLFTGFIKPLSYKEKGFDSPPSLVGKGAGGLGFA
jgi:hypothetical protein